MAEADPQAPPGRPRRALHVHAALIGLEAAAVGFLVVGAVILLGYRSRGDVAEQFAEDWLKQQGVEGDIAVERIDATGFSGRVRLGPANDPDLIADRLEVDYALAAPWAGAPFSITPRSVRLVRPRAKASFDGQKLHFGSLDPLIQDWLKKPKTGGPAPDIRIDDGSIRLSTPYGLLQIDEAQASLSEARLRQLDARLAPTRLAYGTGRADITGGELHLTGDGDALQGGLTLDVAGAAGPTASLQAGQFTLAVKDVRYSLQDNLVGVRALAHVTGTAGALTAGPARLTRPAFDLTFPFVQATLGPRANGRFDARGRFSAAGLDGPVTARGLAGQLSTTGAGWALTGGALRVRGPLDLTAAAQALPLTLAGTPVNLSAAQMRLDGEFDSGLAQMVSGRAAVTARGQIAAARADQLAAATPVLGQEPKYAQALGAALRAFSLSAPNVEIGLGKTVTAAPGAPVVLTSDSGSKATLDPAGLRFDGGLAGGLALEIGGGGLPPIALTAEQIGWRRGVLQAQTALTASLDYGPAREAQVSIEGAARYDRGAFTLTASRCATLVAERLELGENDVLHPAVEACPTPEAPLVYAGQGGWRLQGRLREGRAEAPFLQAVTQGASGAFLVGGDQGPVHAEITLADAPIIDTTKPRRFERLHAAGPLALSGDVWRGALAITADRGQPLGQVSLVHDQASGAGEAQIAAPAIVFARDGLQPVDITPAAALLADAQGSAAFSGRMVWAADQELTSSGRIATTNLAFNSPLGPVSGVAADIALQSLAPIVTAPDQTASAALVETFAPLSDVHAVFQMTEDALRITSARAAFAGGHASLGPTLIPLKEGGLTTGQIDLDDVDLGQIIALTSLADRIKANLVIDGTLPFETDAKSFRLLKGQIATVRPGRLEISREVLSGVETGPATVETQSKVGVVAQAPAVNAVQDVVYQAMENLAVDSLKANLESLPNGRLAALFSIKGHHDPVVAQKTTLTLAELIRGQAFSQKIPLPKGTPIDLTLDTSLNFDEVVKGVQSSFETFRDLHLRSRSATVQR